MNTINTFTDYVKIKRDTLQGLLQGILRWQGLVNTKFSKQPELGTYAGLYKNYNAVSSCPVGVDKSLAYFFDKEQRKKPKKRWEEKFPKEMRAVAASDYNDDKAVFILLTRYLESHYKFVRQSSDGEWQIFSERKKGTEKYQRAQTARIREALSSLVEKGLETMVLTVTCNPSDFEGSRRKAWREWKGKHAKLKKALRKRYRFEYVEVIESTAKGFPHAHMVFGFKPGTVTGWQKMNNRQKITYGDLYNAIKKYSPAPVFHLECLKGDNIKHYLSKYVTKGGTEELNNLILGNEKQKKTARKWAYAMLFSILENTRLYSMSLETSAEVKKRFYLHKNPEGIKEHYVKFLSDNEILHADYLPRTEKYRLLEKKWNLLQKDVDRFLEIFDQASPSGGLPGEARHLLIQICINLPTRCRCSGKMIKTSDYKRLILEENQRKLPRNTLLHEAFEKLGDKPACRGCVLQSIYQLANGMYPDIFNPVVNNPEKDKKEVRLFNGEETADIWLQKFKTAISLLPYGQELWGSKLLRDRDGKGRLLHKRIFGRRGSRRRIDISHAVFLTLDEHAHKRTEAEKIVVDNLEDLL